MKTLFSKMLIVAAALLGSLFTTKVQAQAANPYPIKNDLPCNVVISFSLFKVQDPSSQLPCPLCTTQSGIIIPANGFVNLPIPASCLPLCDLAITVNAIGGVALPNPVTDRVSTAGPTSGPGAGCTTTVKVSALASGGTITN